MTVDAIILAIFAYGFYVGGFIFGMIKVVQSDAREKAAAKAAN